MEYNGVIAIIPATILVLTKNEIGRMNMDSSASRTAPETLVLNGPAKEEPHRVDRHQEQSPDASERFGDIPAEHRHPRSPVVPPSIHRRSPVLPITMADTAVSPTDVVRQTHPGPATWLGNRSGHDSFLVEAATWLRARGLGCRHQVPPHRHPPIGPFDPRMCASVPISGTGVGGVRHGRQDKYQVSAYQPESKHASKPAFGACERSDCRVVRRTSRRLHAGTCERQL